MNDYKELIEETRGFANRLRYYVDEDVPYMEWEIEAVEDAADAIEQLVKERDAAVADLGHACFCDYCKHYGKHFGYPRCKKRGRCEWEWRGVLEDNT